jgi:hypothetical protein
MPSSSTQYAGSIPIKGGDNRWYNNIFCGTGGKPPFQKTRYLPDDAVDASSGYGLSMYDSAALPTYAAGNVYLYGAIPARNEQGTVSTDLRQHNCVWVTTALLGKALIPDAG